MYRLLIILFSIFIISVTGVAAEWKSLLSRDHPLVGRIWAPATETFVEPTQVLAQAVKATYVLLGEKHDNLDHHLLQAKIIEQINRSGRRPAIVFEMIGEDRRADIVKWREGKPADANGLGAALDWAKSGWPQWSYYQPIAEVALAAGLPIVAGNLPKSLARTISREGLRVVDSVRRNRLALDQPLPVKVSAIMRQTLFESHCRLMPKSAMSPLVTVQRVRDAFLSDNLIAAGDRQGVDSAVLIAGNGHVRADFGVPKHLTGRDPSRRILTIAFLEVEPGVTTPKSYGEFFNDALPFDYVWFTPRANDRDYCAELKQRFHGKK